ncbi:hybrid sensor histidine kinase/response regulator [Roseiterribacter gracilis]|uniref:histidine kinase n=1 Tax=Roseiterribacter gracilis TaxID=2812848 RepID=A0A8S8X9W2_9PROT|nr:hypothetical protein TMPK1_02470 [Rhodospirillales bacterium TMPK1]
MDRNPRPNLWRRGAPFWSAVLLVALAMVIVAVLCAINREERLAAAERDVESLADIFAEHADRALQGIDLTIVAARESVQGLRSDDPRDRALAKTNLQRLALGVPQVRIIVWVDAHGQDVADSSDSMNTLNLADRSYFVHHAGIDDDAPHLSEPVLGKRTNQITMNWSRRINAPDGSFAGVIVAGLEPAYFGRFYNAVRREPGDWIGMYRLDGITLARFPQTDFVGATRSNAVLFTDLIPAAPKGTRRDYSGFTGVPRLFAYRVSEIFPIVTTASRPQTPIEAAWLRATAIAAAATLLIGGLALLCVWQLEQRRRWMDAQAREAEANAASRARFVAVMSHEIRTPLNGILGFADLLLDGDLKPQEKHWAATIRDAGNLLRGIVNDVLDLAKIEAGKLALLDAPFELRPTLESTLALMRPLADAKRLVTRAEIARDLPEWVRGDAARLRQILLNLLSNAIKFTNEGSVELRCRALDGERVRFEIADTGAGLTPAQIASLFKPFVQVDKLPSQRMSGTGLGLAISKDLVESMGGTIGIDSAPGVGSIFWFEIALRAAAAVARDEIAVEPGAKISSLKILVADDVPTNQHLLRALLMRDGHRVQIVADGQAAVNAANEQRFDLILMDVEMPLMDGLQATREIRAHGGPSAETPIVAVTANVLPEQIATCRNAGMSDYLSKPIDRDALSTLLARYARTVTAPETPLASDAPDTLARTLDALRGQIGAAPTRELVALSLAHLEQVSARLDALAHDPVTASAEAHAMTSLAGNLGLTELVDASRDLSEQMRTQHGVPPQAWARFSNAVQTGLQELAASVQI